jgi:uncharacterized protein YbcI
MEDVVVCVLRDVFTTAERTLVDSGRREQVEGMRRAFQEVMREEFIQVVEDALGRRVISFMSTTGTDPDVAVEIFLLEPDDGR